MSVQLTAGEAREVAITMAEAGWKIQTIRKYLERRGVRVGWGTVKGWVDPAWDAENRERARARFRRRESVSYKFSWGSVRGPEWRLGRIGALADAGLSQAAIAKVMGVDFPDEPITESQVRQAIEKGIVPRPYRQVLREAVVA